jgi:hypothetical protein
MKRILSLIIIFSTLVCILNAVPALSAEVRVSDVLTEQAEIIQEYWNTINLGNWYDWVETYAPAAREEYMELVSSPEYVNSKTGIMAIESAELLNFSLLSNEYASTVYTELLPYYASSDTVACYKVTANIVADESSPYFRTGKCERVMILVKESGHWYVGASYPYHVDSSGLKVGSGFVNYISEPATIRAKDENGAIHSVSFADCIFNALCNEIGNMGYVEQAVRANAMAVKMYCWWMLASGYHDASGYDVKFGEVAYMSVNRASSANQVSMRNAINALDGIRVTCTVSGTEKLFTTRYTAGTYSSQGKGSGKLQQNGSNYLAVERGYNWKQIMEYYFNNSTANGASVDKISVKHTGSHSYGSYSHDDNYHWRTCTRCFRVAKSGHVWIEGSAYSTCKICNYIKLNVQRVARFMLPMNID